MKYAAAVALASTLSLSALPALAHHSAAMFDDKKTVTLSGVVKDFEYTNPHSWLVIDVMGSGGKVTTWSFEGGLRPGCCAREFEGAIFPLGRR